MTFDAVVDCMERCESLTELQALGGRLRNDQFITAAEKELLREYYREYATALSVPTVDWDRDWTLESTLRPLIGSGNNHPRRS